jgi:Zn-dependent peptidase ImmA (M78 family)
MQRKVPYLQEEQIERDAAALLAEYAQAHGVVIDAPVPIEDIVEKHLKLGLEFDDMHRLFDVPRSGLGVDSSILGAMYFDERRIVIDESLDPEENPSMEGRYRFTLAHEAGGHWRLHRHLFEKDASQTSLFGQPAPPSVVCRSSQAKEPIEWQADYYASCLLMPRTLVLAIWQGRFRGIAPLIYSRLSRTLQVNPPAYSRRPRRLDGAFVDRGYEDFADAWADYFAPKFGVSRQSMRIRLEKLGLLLRETPAQSNFASGV